jgi:hypothetical protein
MVCFVDKTYCGVCDDIDRFDGVTCHDSVVEDFVMDDLGNRKIGGCSLFLDCIKRRTGVNN